MKKDNRNFWGTGTNSGHFVLTWTQVNRTLMMETRAVRGFKLSDMRNG